MKRTVFAVLVFVAMLTASVSASAQNAKPAGKPATEKFAPSAEGHHFGPQDTLKGAPKMDGHKGMAAVTPEMMAQKRTEHMTKELNLTSEQSTQLYKLNLKEAKSHQSTMQQQMKGHETYDTNLKKIIGDENYNKLQQMRKNAPKGQQGAPNCPKMNGKPQGMPQCGQQGPQCCKDGQMQCKKDACQCPCCQNDTKAPQQPCKADCPKAAKQNTATEPAK